MLSSGRSILKTELSWIRRSQRVIRMVCELHRMGYQLIRIMPYEYPIAWRLEIGPKALPAHGGVEAEGLGSDREGPLRVSYSSASENAYFGWEDAATDDARALAAKFVERFPAIAAAGKGRDWEYAGWLIELMGVLERERALSAMYAEYWEPEPGTLGIVRYGKDDSRSAYPAPPQ